MAKVSQALAAKREEAATEISPAGLGREQVKVLEMICAGKSVKETAAAAGVARWTVYRWMRHDPAFAAAYNQWMEEMEESGRSRLAVMTDKALVAVENALEAGDAKSGLALLKALGWMKPSGRRATDAAEMEKRMGMEERKRELELECEVRKMERNAPVERMLSEEPDSLADGEEQRGRGELGEMSMPVRRRVVRMGSGGESEEGEGRVEAVLRGEGEG